MDWFDALKTADVSKPFQLRLKVLFWTRLSRKVLLFPGWPNIKSTLF